ncbi:MAG: MazG nucleotide pyrophosphohydrolase domain-containing protein [Trueperaceae bacterium]
MNKPSSFKDISERALQIRKRYAELEEKSYGRSWSNEEIALGFMGDVGDLAKLVQAKNGVRSIPNFQEKLEHELADCLWSVITLANEFDVDLETAFVKTMDDLETHLSGREHL